MVRPYRRQALLAGCALASLGLSMPANAQAPTPAAPTATPDALGEVVVTARRRTERLIDVPVAVSSMSGEAVARYATTQMADLAQQIPQVNLNKGAGGPGANFQIRGVGSMANDAGVEQTVAVNVDGVIVSRARGIIGAGLLDIQGVEVLKGPQALFFGKNSPGGVISLNSVNPGPAREGYLRAGYDFLDQQRYVEGAVTQPLGHDVSARVALRWDDSRGYIRNEAVAQPDVFHPGFTTTPSQPWGPGVGNVLGRITLTYRPAGAFDATLKVYQDHYTDEGPGSSNELLRCGPGQTHPVIAGQVDPTGDCSGNYKVSVAGLDPRISGPFPIAGDRPFSKIDTTLASLNMNYKADWVTVTSTTGYFRFANRYDQNFDYTSRALLMGAADEHNETLSQELRAVTGFSGPVNVTTGFYYEHLNRSYRQDTFLAPLPKDPATGRYDTADGLYFIKGNTYSGFAQLNIKLAPTVELAGGARYTHEDRSADLGNIYVSPFRVGQLPVGVRLKSSLKDDNVSPEATLSWHPQRNTTIYAAYKTGFLSSGFSNPGNLTASATVSNIQFKSVKAKGGEIGAKGSFMGGRLGLDATAYLYDYEDLQLTSFDATTFTYITKNAASARVQGVEIQGRYTIGGGFAAHGFVSYNRARFQSFPNAQCFAGETAAQGCVAGVQNLSGQPMGASPESSVNLGATYDRPVGGGWTAAVSADAYYIGRYNFSAGGSNFRPDSIQNPYGKLNASLRLYNAKGLEFALIGQNLTNSKWVVSSADAPGLTAGSIYGMLGRPREIVVQATYRF
jgi:iron complex outermembrane receptor protein